MKFAATVGSRTHVVDVIHDDGGYRITIGGTVWNVDARQTAHGTYSLLVDGASYTSDIDGGGGTYAVTVGGETYAIQVEEHTRYVIRTHGGTSGGGAGQILKAPLPGKITHVAVREGETVTTGQSLVVIEAMKMENELKATASGVVREIRVAAGHAVNAGDVLVVIEGR